MTCRTGDRFETGQALKAAATAYAHYTASAQAIECLARLSAAMRERDSERQMAILGSSIIRLHADRYVLHERQSNHMPRLTPLGIVAINLVHGEQYGEDFDAQLKEPFTTMPVLSLLPTYNAVINRQMGIHLDGDTFQQTFSEEH